MERQNEGTIIQKWDGIGAEEEEKPFFPLQTSKSERAAKLSGTTGAALSNFSCTDPESACVLSTPSLAKSISALLKF